MIKFSQNCGNDRYGVCSNAIPRLNRIFFTRFPTPVASEVGKRDFTPPSGGGDSKSLTFKVLSVRRTLRSRSLPR